jgi:hypothetical protein
MVIGYRLRATTALSAMRKKNASTGLLSLRDGGFAFVNILAEHSLCNIFFYLHEY